MPQTTCEDLDRLNKEMLAFIDSKNLTGAVGMLVATGLLLSVIQACKSIAPVPFVMLQVEPLLEEALRHGVPVVTAPDGKYEAALEAIKRRMN